MELNVFKDTMEPLAHGGKFLTFESSRRLFWLIVAALALVLAIGLPITGYKIVSRFRVILFDQVMRDNDALSHTFESFLRETRRITYSREEWLKRVQEYINNYEIPNRGYICLVDSNAYLQAAPNRAPSAPPVLAKDWTFIPVSPANGQLDYSRTLRTEDLIRSTPETKISGHWHNTQEDQLVDFRLINIDGEKWLIGIHQFENTVQEQLKEIVPFVVAVGSFLFLAIVIPFGMFTARLMHHHEHERDMYIRRIEQHTREIEKFAAQLKETNENLHSLQQQKNRLYARLSHDLRTPLNSILSASSLIADGIYGEITPKQAHATEIIHRNIQVLLHLIDGILQLSRVESGHVTLETESFELDSLLRNLVENLQPLAESNNLELRYQPNPALPRLHTDRDKFYLILQNLISNAIKFTHEGYVELSAEPRADASVAIAVRDTGPGISPGDQDRIFHEFTRGPNSNSGPKGVGLGLTITKELTQLLGGRITVHSVPGKGATFTVILPPSAVESASAAAPLVN